jgi:hypothetical protein
MYINLNADELRRFNKDPNSSVFFNAILLDSGIIDPNVRVRCIMAIKSLDPWTGAASKWDGQKAFAEQVSKEMPQDAIDGLPRWQVVNPLFH